MRYIIVLASCPNRRSPTDSAEQAKIKASEGKMEYAVALKEVMEENPKLATEYNDEQNNGAETA